VTPVVTNMARKDMPTGTVFGILDHRWPSRRDALVVLDAKREVGLWTGALSVWGDVAPGFIFEVL
jgi:hypothetical protein